MIFEEEEKAICQTHLDRGTAQTVQPFYGGTFHSVQFQPFFLLNIANL